MSWGLPPQVEEIFSTNEDPDRLTKKLLKAGIDLNWDLEIQKDNYLYFTRKQQHKLIRFFLKNEKTDITINVGENGVVSLRSCGPNFPYDGGINNKNISEIKKQLSLS